MRRYVRLTGALLVTAGAALSAWAALVWAWQDPFTYVLMRWDQRALAAQHAERMEAFRGGGAVPAARAEVERWLRRHSGRYRRGLETGDAVGRIVVPRLGLNLVLVYGTDHDALERGPGLDPRASLPGQGELAYIAGHRTTFGAPFSDIDGLDRGDRVSLVLPYGRFEYAITGHRVVPASFVQALRSRGREELALQACHPRFFASHRYIVYARPVRVTPRGGRPLLQRAMR